MAKKLNEPLPLPPWKASPEKHLVDANGVEFIVNGAGGSDELRAFIARACNAHDDLLAACKMMDAVSGCGGFVPAGFIAARDAARAAIALAEAGVE